MRRSLITTANNTRRIEEEHERTGFYIFSQCVWHKIIMEYAISKPVYNNKIGDGSAYAYLDLRMPCVCVQCCPYML